jgi:hypothetical protein
MWSLTAERECERQPRARHVPAMTSYLQSICCVFFCATAVGGEEPRGPQPQPINDRGLSELVGIALRYGLPLPPKSAPLVLGNTDWRTGVGLYSGSDLPYIYSPAFLLERLPHGRARVLMGWEEKVVTSSTEYSPATRPYSLVSPRPVLKGYVLDCGNLSSVVVAVQLAQRGATEDAKKLWDQVRTVGIASETLGDDMGGPGTTDPRVILGRCLYEHFDHLSLAENGDLTSIYEKLLLLQEQFPVLFSDDPHGRSYFRSRFVRALGLALHAPKPAVGSVEALLVEWGSRTGSTSPTGDIEPLVFCDPAYGDDVRSDRSACEILRRGVRAMPDLARLVDDERLTRHVIPRFNNRPSGRLCLGALAEALLWEMSGSQDLKAWMSIEHGELAERQFFEKAAVISTPTGIAEFRDVPLWILGEKYPQSLLALCMKVPKRPTADTRIIPLVNAITQSKLTRREKTDALSGLCQRFADFRWQRCVLQTLAKLDEPKCVALLRPILAKLPDDVNEPYWTCEAARYTHVVMQLQDDEIWKEYQKIAGRAAVGLRMQIMEPMDYSYTGDTNRARRILFLTAFLDDGTVRDKELNRRKYEGPCAAFTIPRIEVRDFAAMKIASLLDLDDRPTEFWTKDQWTRLRSKVKTELNRQKSFPPRN